MSVLLLKSKICLLQEKKVVVLAGSYFRVLTFDLLSVCPLC